MPDEDVTPAADPSTAVASQAAEAAGTAPGDVTPVQGDDRPVQNVVAEFNRKFGKLQQQMETLMQIVATQQGAPKTATPGKADPTDDELWSLAQQGDRSAFELYMRRIAEQSGQSQVRALEKQRTVESQLAILATRYPVFNDAAHPLTQQANSVYAMLVAQGEPAGRTTLLEAIKTAIADRPDLVAEIHQRTAPASLRRDRAQAGVTGTTVREEPVTTKQRALTANQAALAQRMGVKDPSKAMERFQRRQDAGQSSVADTLHPFIREE